MKKIKFFIDILQKWCLRSESNGRHLVFQTSALTWLSYPGIFGAPLKSRTSDLTLIRRALLPSELKVHIREKVSGKPVCLRLSLLRTSHLWHAQRDSNSRLTEVRSLALYSAELWAYMASQIGFEPMTHGVEARCSNSTELLRYIMAEGTGFEPMRLLHRQFSKLLHLTILCQPSIKNDVSHWLVKDLSYSTPKHSWVGLRSRSTSAFDPQVKRLSSESLLLISVTCRRAPWRQSQNLCGDTSLQYSCWSSSKPLHTNPQTLIYMTLAYCTTPI